MFFTELKTEAMNIFVDFPWRHASPEGRCPPTRLAPDAFFGQLWLANLDAVLCAPWLEYVGAISEVKQFWS